MIIFNLLPKLFSRMNRILFFLLNKHRFKKLSFRSSITKPLRIDGSKNISIHSGVVIQKFTWLFTMKIDEYDPDLVFNEGCIIGNFNHIAAVRKVVFGKYVLTADRVYISDNLHDFNDINVPIMHQPIKFRSEVYIGDGSWVGENVCIIGAKIGKNCIIGANSVVTRDIPDYCVAVGAPAKVIKRFNILKKSWESSIL